MFTIEGCSCLIFRGGLGKPGILLKTSSFPASGVKGSTSVVLADEFSHISTMMKGNGRDSVLCALYLVRVMWTCGDTLKREQHTDEEPIPLRVVRVRRGPLLLLLG
jgi:hypothetical protein